MSRPNKALALKRLREVLGKMPALKTSRLDAPEFVKWYRDARVALGRTFGQGSEQVGEFLAISFSPRLTWDGTPDSSAQSAYIAGLSRAEVNVQSMIDEIEEFWESQETVTQGDRVVLHTRKVFLVHGHDEGAKDGVARFLEKLGLETVVLAEMPSKGKTIIEKFETHADVGFAVVLLTADDRGARRGQDPSPRARQNVIFELGYFIGRLGRERVCALTRGDPDIPSDYAGVVYIRMDDDSWKMPLVKELKAADLDFDANKAFD